jgi:hypothetical protein
MDWTKPELKIVNMSAEIGAYQDDNDEREGFHLDPRDEADAPMSVAND